MNNLSEQEVNYKILKLLSIEPNLSQRAIAGRMGISLGKTNYVLSELAEKGILKIKRFKSAPNKIPYTWCLNENPCSGKFRISKSEIRNKFEYQNDKMTKTNTLKIRFFVI